METDKLIETLSKSSSVSLYEINSLIHAATTVDLSSSLYFSLNGINVYPKEIEVYAYKEGLFPDDSVHRNERQQNNKGHFYVHRFSKSKDAPYKGRAGVDYCFSDVQDLYYTWLIRSAYFEGIGPVYGPCNVRKAILQVFGKDAEQLEKESFEIHSKGNVTTVLFSERINLSERVTDKWRTALLRAVVADDLFKSAKYKQKEALVVNYVDRLIKANLMDRESCIMTGVDILGYRPSALK